MHSGFARAEVAEVTAADGSGDLTVTLSEPWRPEPWSGPPIRYLLVFDRRGPPAGGAPIRTWPQITVQLADGRTAQIP